MKIVLMQHAEVAPATLAHQTTTQQESEKFEPTVPARSIGSTCRTVVSSDLPSSLTSVQMFGFSSHKLADACFREPNISSSVPQNTKGSLTEWLQKLAWKIGLNSKSESYIAAKKRAETGAGQLAELAKNYGSVLFLGQALATELIATQLKRLGWRPSFQLGRNEWSYTVFELA